MKLHRHRFHCKRCVAAFFIRRIGVAFAISCFILSVLLWAQCHQARYVGEKPHAEGSVAWVLDHHECLDDGGQLPGHVIAAYPGEGYRYLGEKGVRDAFEQLTHDGVFKPNRWTRPIDHNMRVSRFCH